MNAVFIQSNRQNINHLNTVHTEEIIPLREDIILCRVIQVLNALPNTVKAKLSAD